MQPDWKALVQPILVAALLAAGGAGLLLWRDSVPRSELAALAEKVQALKEEQVRVGLTVTLGLEGIRAQLDDLKRQSRPGPAGGGS